MNNIIPTIVEQLSYEPLEPYKGHNSPRRISASPGKLTHFLEKLFVAFCLPSRFPFSGNFHNIQLHFLPVITFANIFVCGLIITCHGSGISCHTDDCFNRVQKKYEKILNNSGLNYQTFTPCFCALLRVLFLCQRPAFASQPFNKINFLNPFQLGKSPLLIPKMLIEFR